MRDTAIFLGPSLELAMARSILDAVYLPPVKRGDLLLLPPEVRTVGIIDGEFFQSLAVSPKEVLELLDRGVKVYGSSSMGALRAVETAPWGMVGIGTVFAMYRDGVIDADDEVAMTYDPGTYRTTSEALVNIRCALRAAVESHVIQQSEADQIVQVTRGLYFPERSYQPALEICPQLRAFLKAHRPNQKRADASLLLQTIAKLERHEQTG
jgi:hypothetical protein